MFFFPLYNRTENCFHSRVLKVCRLMPQGSLHSLSASDVPGFTKLQLKPRANSATTDKKKYKTEVHILEQLLINTSLFPTSFSMSPTIRPTKKEKRRIRVPGVSSPWWADEGELQDTRYSPTEMVRMYGAGTEQLLSDHFSTGSTDLSSNPTGMWMSAEPLVKSYHHIKALYSHILASPRLFGIGLHWI